MGKNTEEYRGLDVVSSHSEEGIYFLITSEHMQRVVVGHYEAANACVYDCK